MEHDEGNCENCGQPLNVAAGKGCSHSSNHHHAGTYREHRDIYKQTEDHKELEKYLEMNSEERSAYNEEQLKLRKSDKTNDG